MKSAVLSVLAAALFVAASPVFAPVAEAKPPRLEYREGQREIARERAKMRQNILNSDTRRQAERAFTKGMRNINDEKREMRWEINRSVRHRYAGRILAGIVLGEIIRVAIVGRPPVPPRPDLCWYWSNTRRDTGDWYYCSGD